MSVSREWINIGRIAEFPASATKESTLQAVLDRLNAGIPANVTFPNPLPVSGPLTDTQLRASAVAVTGPLTDAQLRASNVPVGIGDGPNLDAFSRLRVSNPSGIFSAQSQYNAEPLMYENGATGTGVAPAFNSATRMCRLSCTTGTGLSFKQSFEYIHYQPGKSQLIFLTGVLGAPLAGKVVDVGYGDASNGIFYRQSGLSGVSVVLRSSTSGSPVERTAAQASWNLDPMDGSGSSGITLDTTACYILVIDLQFLSMGRVRIGFDINGSIVYVHEFLNANILTVPYMQTASLPILHTLTATAVASTVESFFKCASVSSEGGYETQLGADFATPSVTATAANGSNTHILSIRPKTTFNSLVNRTVFLPHYLNILVTGNYPVHWSLVIGAAFSAAPTWADVNSTYSAFEYGYSGTYLNLTNGIEIDSGYVPASNQNKGSISQNLARAYPISLNRAGAVRALGTLSVLVQGLGGSSDCYACLQYQELR